MVFIISTLSNSEIAKNHSKWWYLMNGVFWRGNTLMHANVLKVKIRRPPNSWCQKMLTKDWERGISLLSSFPEEVYLVPWSRDHFDNVLYARPEIARIWWRIFLSKHSWHEMPSIFPPYSVCVCVHVHEKVLKFHCYLIIQ